MSSLATLRVLVEMGLTNLRVHRMKSLVVGAIMFFGTMLVVVGSAMLDSVQASMQRSITSSLSGDVQVYSADAPDAFSLFPMGSSGNLDYGELDDYPRVRDTLMGVANVRDVVPMGFTTSIVFGTPELDRVLEQLRDSVDSDDAAGVKVQAAHVRAIALGLGKDLRQSMTSSSDPERVQDQIGSIDEVLGEDFWKRFDEDPAAGLEFLDTRVAPAAIDGTLLYLRLLGSDLDQFSTSFESFELVEGRLPEPGEPGLLLAERFYERQAKNKVAREIDALSEGLAEGRTIAEDNVLSLAAQRLPNQVQGLLYQLSPADAQEVRAALAPTLGEGALEELMPRLLTMDDGNFQQHRDLFYSAVAPHIRLYEMPLGEEVVLRGFTRSGYMRAVSVRVTGIFQFSGLEGSDLASSSNLIDLNTFRSLYGRMTAAQQGELDDIRAQSGVRDISRADAEDALFGGGPTEPAAFGEPDTEAGSQAAAPAAARPTDDKDLVLNAAVFLDDPRLMRQTMADIQEASDAAGLGLQVIDWQQAAGTVGQMLLVMRVVLYVAIFIIFLVALVIINNTMVMATMDRSAEIGTMRAIGAPRRFVVQLFVIETLALGAVAGGLGALAGVGVMLWLKVVGVPAVADILVLLFAGKRLYPDVTMGNVGLGLGAILTISLFSTLYPAVLAARVAPIVAMQGKE